MPTNEKSETKRSATRRGDRTSHLALQGLVSELIGHEGPHGGANDVIPRRLFQDLREIGRECMLGAGPSLGIVIVPRKSSAAGGRTGPRRAPPPGATCSRGQGSRAPPTRPSSQAQAAGARYGGVSVSVPVAEGVEGHWYRARDDGLELRHERRVLRLENLRRPLCLSSHEDGDLIQPAW